VTGAGEQAGSPAPGSLTIGGSEQSSSRASSGRGARRVR